MNRYVFEDLIINPEVPGLEDLIGKEVYFCDIPLKCLKWANKDDNCKTGILKEICKDDMMLPFSVEIPNGMILRYACIIPKKEPKPEYIPFETMEEFVDRYNKVMKWADYDSFEDNLMQCGMWLKDVDDNDKPVYILVHEIRDEGVKLDEHGRLNWEELLSKGFLFPNNTPCGKLAESE